MTFDFKNLAENLIYIISALLVGGLIGFSSANVSNKQTTDQFLEHVIPIFEDAVKKETNKIQNTFKTEFKKAKVKNGALQIDYKPEIDNGISIEKDSLILKTPTNTVKEKKKRKFLGFLRKKK